MSIAVAIFVLAVLVGVVGAMGNGGALLLLPLLAVFVGVPIKTAIGASLISVIVTSTTVGAVSVRQGVSHTRLSIVLEVATTLGALVGAAVAIFLNPRVLQAILGLVLVYIVLRRRGLPHQAVVRFTGMLDAAYVDPVSGATVGYGVRNVPLGLLASFVAGNLSGLLGTGGGFIKVPIMTFVMGMPAPAAVATSSLMIAVTAATSAEIYYLRGYIDPRVAIPTALGVLLGAQLGARFGRRGRTTSFRERIRGWALARAASAAARLTAARGPGAAFTRLPEFPADLIVIRAAAAPPGTGPAGAAPAGAPAGAAQVYVNRELLDLVTGRRPVEIPAPAVQEGRVLNTVVHGLLRLGLAFSGALLLTGGGLNLLYQGALPAVDLAPLDALRGALRFDPAGLLALGLGALVATPIVALAGSLLVFLTQRDWRYAGITGVVLVITLISVWVGAH